MQAKQTGGYGKENLSEQQDTAADSILPGAGVFAETVFQKLCTVLKSIHMPRPGKRKSPTGSCTTNTRALYTTSIRMYGDILGSY